MNEIEKIEATLASEWWDAKDEWFWKRRIAKLVAYVKAAEIIFRSYHNDPCCCVAHEDFRDARKNLGLGESK